jgi:nicotinate-nucleotide--dimethylbenzimidazole phosphoribosyltransferase
VIFRLGGMSSNVVLPSLPFDAVVFDIGGTIVAEAAPGTPVDELRVRYLGHAPRALAALRGAGVRVAAVTDTATMREGDVRALLAAGGGVSDLIEELVTSTDLGVAKPAPDGIDEVLRRLGVDDRSRVLVVGDRDVDEKAAATAGCRFARVDGTTTLAATVLAAAIEAGASPISAAVALVSPVDEDAAQAADERQLNLTKPPGSLGQLESIGARLAAITGEVPPPVPEPAALGVFAGDHGVVDAGVTPWPREVTAQMIANVATGGAAVSVLARQAGLRVNVVDVGVATPYPDGLGIVAANVAAGTANLADGPAMTVDQALAALDVGVRQAVELVSSGARLLATGDMGIGNTTPSAALTALETGNDAATVTGRGTGIDDPTLALKVGVVDGAIARARVAGHTSGVDALVEVGGLEHAAIAGFVLGGAACGVPVVVDGVIATSALLVARSLSPEAVDHVIAGHRSAEPGASVGLDHLGLEPVVDLGLRLGEGTGAVLAVPIVQAAARLLGEMATFDSAGVSGSDG